MKKICFPYVDQPRQFCLKFQEPVRFPFYVDDLVYYWEVGTTGITLYLINEAISKDTPTIKDILLEDSGIVFYLVNETTQVFKHIYVEFAKIGKGVYKLGMLDPFTLGELDGLTLGDISTCFANWMNMTTSSISLSDSSILNLNDIDMQIKVSDILPYDKHIFMENLKSNMSISGLYDEKSITLGELDPHLLSDIDSMLVLFKRFDSIPAQLVKWISIRKEDVLQGKFATSNLEFGIDIGVQGTGIGLQNQVVSLVTVTEKI